MVHLRRYLAAGFLGFMAVVWGGAAAIYGGIMAACCAVFAAGDLVAAIALARRWFWARWLGLGIGLVGTLNVAVWLALGNWATDPLLVIQGAGFPLLLAILLGNGMRAQFELRPSPRNHWDFSRPAMRLLSWAVVLDIATAPMLLLYGCSADTGLAGPVRAVAIVTAVVLAIAVVLVVMGRSAGLVVMAIAGVATMTLGAHALPMVIASHDPAQVFVTMTAVAAFPPGILGALASVVVFARPVAEFLRTR